MEKKDPSNVQSIQEALSNRSLEKNVPKLKELLKSGMNVLDVGCGTGTITADVAAAVAPGRVVGLNTRKEDDQIARQTAKDRGVSDNTSFVLGDTHSLDFEDSSFDLVYSYTAAHFFIDPVRAFKEQARVTKENGYVVAAGVRDFGQHYPRCEAWEKVYDACIRYNDQLCEEYRNANSDPVSALQNYIQNVGNYIYYWDIQAGRKCVEWLTKAGLVDISISINVSEGELRYPKDNLMRPQINDLLDYGELTEDRREYSRPHLSGMLEAGFIDKETIEAAEKEAAAWIKNPYAMDYWVLVFASGRVIR